MLCSAGAFRQGSQTQGKSEREKWVLKPFILKEHRKAKRKEETTLGPGSYHWEDSIGKVGLASRIRHHDDTLYGVGSPTKGIVAKVTQHSASSLSGSKAFPHPVSLASCGISFEEAQAMRRAICNRQGGWARDTSTRDMYNIKGARGAAGFCPPGVGPGISTDAYEMWQNGTENRGPRPRVTQQPAEQTPSGW